MQLVGAILSEYKSIRHVELPLEGLTVLFGPNGAGKSNIIEALSFHDEVARRSLQRRRDEDQRQSRVGLVVRFDISLDGEGSDGETLLDMLSFPWIAGIPAMEISDGIGAHCGTTWWLEGGDLTAEEDRGSLGAALAVIRAAILADVPAPDRSAAERFLDLLLDQPYLLVQEDFAVDLTFDRGTPQGSEIVQATDELLGLENGVLSHIVGVVRSWTGRWPPLALMTRGPGAVGVDIDERVVPAGFEWLSARLGGVAVVSGDVDSVERYLDQALEQAHDRLFHRPYGSREELDEFADIYCDSCLTIHHGGHVDPSIYEEIPIRPTPRSWLEEQDEGWARVRPGLIAALEVIERQTNDQLPQFVSEQGRVRLVMNPVTEWADDRPRCRIMFELDPDDAGPRPADWDGPIGVVGHAGPRGDALRTVPLVDLGSGLRRWVATSVRLAADTCGAGAVSLLLEGDLDPGADPATAIEIVDILVRDNPTPRILLVDEPEQHLHPSAQHVVAAWAANQARQHHAVVVATHSPAFFGLPPEQAKLCEVRREGHETYVRPLRSVHGPAAVEQARQLGFELGLGRDALAQLTRAVTVVEGEWDRQLLYQYYGVQLAEQRLLVVPLQGSDELGAMADAAVIPALGVPVIALLDEVRAASHSDLAALTGKISKAERALRDLAAALGDNLKVVRYDDPDVICALPEDAVRRAYPAVTFPGWDRLLDDWRHERHSGATDWSFKRWAIAQFGLPKKERTPSAFFRRVLENDAGCAPHPRFRNAAMQVLAYAGAREPLP